MSSSPIVPIELQLVQALRTAQLILKAERAGKQHALRAQGFSEPLIMGLSEHYDIALGEIESAIEAARAVGYVG